VTHSPTLDDGIAGVAFIEAACTPKPARVNDQSVR
jgi:hypothetical protein